MIIKKNIGVTIGLKSDNESVWNNGIKLNALYLAKTLINSGMYNVFIINTTDYTYDKDKIPWDNNTIPFYQLNEIKNDLDILFVLGGQIDEKTSLYFKNKKTKLISYKCGNEYVIRMEQVIFNKNVGNIRIWNNPHFDEIWTVPQIYEQNKYYLKRFHKNKNVKSVPFVWDSFLLDEENKKQNGKCFYQNKRDKKNITILEPNNDVLKYCMFPALITDHVYSEQPELIDKMYVTNTSNIRTNNIFVQYMKHLNIVKDKKAFFEDRFPTSEILSTLSDVVVSHQWDNPLNYFYLDVVYYNHPLIHNAHMCKDVGYYYEGFNGDEAKDKLHWVLENHDNNKDKYKEKNQKQLKKYRANNPDIINQYVTLINKLK